MRKIIAAVVLALIASAAHAQQPIDPQAALDALIRQQLEKNARAEAERRQEEALRQRYASLSIYELQAELDRYCPNGPPCLYSPPDALLHEAAKRGLIRFRSAPGSGNDCVFLGDGLGGGIGDCQ